MLTSKYTGLKASELVEKLNKLISEYGDLPIMHSLGDGCYLELQEIYHHSDVQDSEDGVFQLTNDHRDRDDYVCGDLKFDFYENNEVGYYDTDLDDEGNRR